MDGTKIVTALKTLREKLPGCDVELWAKLKADGREEYTAFCWAPDHREHGCFTSDCPTTAIEGILEDWNPDSYRQRRIDELKAQLHKLESQPA